MNNNNNWDEKLKGGGRASARETIGRVAAGAVAKKILRELSGTEVCSSIIIIYLLFFFY